MSRLFIGIYPPVEVCDAIRELPRPEMAGVRWVPEHQWHVTLRFFGNIDEDDARDVFAAVAQHPEVTAEMGPYVSRLGRDVVCIPVLGIETLAASVARATADVGEPPDPRPFAGHLTLARLRGRGTCGVAGERFAQSFRVSELALVRSTLTPSGADHETIATCQVGS